MLIEICQESRLAWTHYDRQYSCEKKVMYSGGPWFLWRKMIIEFSGKQNVVPGRTLLIAYILLLHTLHEILLSTLSLRRAYKYALEEWTFIYEKHIYTLTKLPFAKFYLTLIRRLLQKYGKQKSNMRCFVTRNSNNPERVKKTWVEVLVFTIWCWLMRGFMLWTLSYQIWSLTLCLALNILVISLYCIKEYYMSITI